MNRRDFIRKTGGGIVLLASSPALLNASYPAETSKAVRFGLITDLHFARREENGNRYYEQSIEKLSDAVGLFKEEKVDFIIELGDLKDQDITPRKETTLQFLDEIENTLHTFKGPVYHVLGNHDMDSLSKADFLGHTRNYGKAKGKNYYSFTHDKIKFIVLDGNYNEDGSDYDCGNFQWTKAMIPTAQKKWLEEELAKDKHPVIIFVHQLLDSFSDITKEVCILNAEEIVGILEKSGKVLAVFQGHHHYGHYSLRNGIHYFTLKGMIEGPYPANNSYALVEIDKDKNIFVRGYANCEDKKLFRLT